jgi:hypothetical protein
MHLQIVYSWQSCGNEFLGDFEGLNAMDRLDRFVSHRVVVFVKNHLFTRIKAYSNHRCLRSMIEQVFYLFTPESTIKTGFEKITRGGTDSCDLAH